jgi:protein-S-isoprenylcysteine O-methyltransferase Ste14
MFGIPLTIYLLAPLLGAEPRMFGGNESHLWAYLLFRAGSMNLETGLYLVMVISSGLMAIGFYLLAMGWKEVYRDREALVTDGLYTKIRHPQYMGLILIIVGFLVMWPTLLTLLLAPLLLARYILLAKEEDRELEEKFGEDFVRYKEKVPAFIP